ncbi:hypothetical protein [Burkholderia stagnalis]|uniref:hypothetical protein n=1 Tax=Burkholderia stagnalis TaxID=1503054 RepID=UPI000F5684AA|nr:hypothetical protein [Burkholderia stagnalis]RQQ54279.1 hypothetical protein DF145_05155 [Burkholderia stagnalis]RQY03956.1 hypothetical protein DF121_08255 [Burkholderia stagnalis]RQY21627.1 hypothetical protein DF115_06370 [Burkholderia stagnalis]RQY32160.1 hypothetical protein DF114_11970 [Burkholderia stagnalis]
MKKALLLFACLAAGPAVAQSFYGHQHSNSSLYGGNSNMYGSDQTVSGYTRSDGTYVQPYHRTAPDGNPYNNYSTQGNVNPYTGQPGYKNPGY